MVLQIVDTCFCCNAIHNFGLVSMKNWLQLILCHSGTSRTPCWTTTSRTKGCTLIFFFNIINPFGIVFMVNYWVWVWVSSRTCWTPWWTRWTCVEGGGRSRLLLTHQIQIFFTNFITKGLEFQPQNCVTRSAESMRKCGWGDDLQTGYPLAHTDFLSKQIFPFSETFFYTDIVDKL